MTPRKPFDLDAASSEFDLLLERKEAALRSLDADRATAITDTVNDFRLALDGLRKQRKVTIEDILDMRNKPYFADIQKLHECSRIFSRMQALLTQMNRAHTEPDVDDWRLSSLEVGIESQMTQFRTDLKAHLGDDACAFIFSEQDSSFTENNNEDVD